MTFGRDAKRLADDAVVWRRRLPECRPSEDVDVDVGVGGGNQQVVEIKIV